MTLTTLTLTDSEWAADALCHDGDPELLFTRGASQNLAKMVCRQCPVQAACLADALDHRVEHGVWGGMTERERRALLRQRPDVTSWRQLFADAAVGQQRQAPA